MANSFYDFINKRGEIIKCAFDRNNSEIINFIFYATLCHTYSSHSFKIKLHYAHNIYDLLNDVGKYAISYSEFIESVCYYEKTCILTYLIDRQDRTDTVEFGNLDFEYFNCVVKRDNTYNSIFMDSSNLYDDFYNFRYNIMENFKEFSRLSHKREYYTEVQNAILTACYRLTSRDK